MEIDLGRVKGLSAYEIAVENGFKGTEQEWLLSLKGEQGLQGIQGEKGDKGDTGEQGLQGEKGDAFTFSDFTQEQLANLKGKDGVNGVDGKDGKDGQNGTDGVDGKSAYEIAVDNGFIGTEQEWLNSLRGETTNAKKGHIYGIRRNIESSDPSWERIWDSVGLEANAIKDDTEVKNDFDHIYPWSDIVTYNYNTTTHKITAFIGEPSFKFDGSNGEVMTRFPEFWYKRENAKGENGNTYEYIYIADYAEEGFEKSEQFSLSRYTVSGSTTKLSSKSAIGSLVGVIPQNFRNATKLLGNNWASLDIKHWSILQLLYLVEYANYNVQSALGKGATQVSGNESLVNGGCDSLGMKSGCLANDGIHSVVYRGIENIFGNLWQFIDGINIKNFNTYVCYDIENYASDVFSNNYKQLGYINSSETVQFTKKVGYDKNNFLIQMPIAGGGSSDTYTGDCYWCSTGNRVVWAGGNWRDGDYAGLWCLDCSEAFDVSHEYRGYRLLLVEGGENNESV